MKYKAGLARFMLTVVVSVQLFVPNVALASTVVSKPSKPTTILISGHVSLHTTHVISKDPWSGIETTWIPIDSVQKALKEVGFGTTWNGNEFSFVKYPPGYTLAALGNPEAIPTKSQIALYLVAGAPPSLSMPMIIDNGVKYMPIYYLDTIILNHYWRTNAKWNGNTNTWSFNFHPVW